MKFIKYHGPKEIIDFFIGKQIENKKNIKEINKYVLLTNIFIGHYIKIFPNTFVVLEINSKSDVFSSDMVDLKNNLLYKNKIKLNGKILSNVMFCLFQNYIYLSLNLKSNQAILNAYR